MSTPETRPIQVEIREAPSASGIVYCGECLDKVGWRISYGHGSEDEGHLTKDDLEFLAQRAKDHVEHNPSHWVHMVIYQRL
jgi:hypothetical protein